MSDEQSTEAAQVADLAAPRSAGAEAALLGRVFGRLVSESEAARKVAESRTEAQTAVYWRIHETWHKAAGIAGQALSELLAAGASSVGTDEAEAG